VKVGASGLLVGEKDEQVRRQTPLLALTSLIKRWHDWPSTSVTTTIKKNMMMAAQQGNGP
jgi:hypothetical protein